MKINFRFALIVAAFATALYSCDDPSIDVGQSLDMSGLESVKSTDAALLDPSTNSEQKSVVMYDSSIDFELYLHLNKVAGSGVSALFSIDESYLTEYNTANGTSYELLPTSLATLGNGGVLNLAPDELESDHLPVTIACDLSLTANQVYALPISISVPADSSHFINEAEPFMLFVEICDEDEHTTCDKGEGKVKNIVFFETGDVNPLNALEWVLSDGTLFFDYVVLFSANINYNTELGRVYMSRNESIQFLLDNSEEYIQPLRRRGMKVIMSLLGNWDESGLMQLSTLGIDMFATDCISYAHEYGFDGFCFDNEYSNSPDLTNPLFTSSSIAAGSELVYTMKCLDPSLIMMTYQYNGFGATGYTMTTINGCDPGDYVDIAVADYGRTTNVMVGHTVADCSGYSHELNYYASSYYSGIAESTARSRVESGYGYYMYFSLNPSSYNITNSQQLLMQNTALGLYNPVSGVYDITLNDATHYYPMYSTVRTPIDEL